MKSFGVGSIVYGPRNRTMTTKRQIPNEWFENDHAPIPKEELDSHYSKAFLDRQAQAIDNDKKITAAAAAQKAPGKPFSLLDVCH